MHAKVQRVRITLRLSKWRKGVEKEGFGVCRADNYPVKWSVNLYARTYNRTIHLARCSMCHRRTECEVATHVGLQSRQWYDVWEDVFECFLDWVGSGRCVRYIDKDTCAMDEEGKKLDVWMLERRGSKEWCMRVQAGKKKPAARYGYIAKEGQGNITIV